MPRLGLAGDVGFNRHRRDGTTQAWGGITHGKDVSYLVKEVLDKPKYSCNRGPINTGKIYGPENITELMAPHPKHDSQQYKAFHRLKLVPGRPILWARDSKGRPCTYETQSSVLDGPVTSLNQAKRDCRYYPHQPNIIMKTVMNFAHDYKPKRLNRQAALFRAMGIKEIAETIFESMSFASRAQFSRTCSDAMLVASSFQTLYDMARQDFQYSEYTEEEFVMMKREKSEFATENQHQRGAKHLLISQCHLEYIREASDILDPAHPRILTRPGYRRFATYCALSESVGRLTRSILLWGNHTEYLTLHRVPFVDGKVITGWARQMPKLNRLEIIGCEMVRFHHMAPLYRDIAKIQRVLGTKIEVEISPLHETGTRWENLSDVVPIRDHRSGEYVVCWADVGIKIPSAVTVELFWQLFPAMFEAGQWETILDLASATRQYLERLPMPRMAIPIVICIFSEWIEILKDIENAEAKWTYEHPSTSLLPTGSNTGGGTNQGPAQGHARSRRRQRPGDREAQATPNPCPGTYDPAHWSSTLRRKVTEFIVKRNHALAFAMFGTERWIETADRNEMSTNTQCRTDNYGIWGVDKSCFQCKLRLPMIAFTAGGLCENCRLENACEDEMDHLKQEKKNAVQALGFHVLPAWPDETQTAQVGASTLPASNPTAQGSNQPVQVESESDDDYPGIDIRGIVQSNFPKPEAFWKIDDEGNRVNLVDCPRGLTEVLSHPNGPLADFFTQALQMDMLEAKYGPIGHIGSKQEKHPSGQYLQLGQSSRQMAGHYMYRRCISIEDFIQTPDGLTPSNVRHNRGGL